MMSSLSHIYMIHTQYHVRFSAESKSVAAREHEQVETGVLLLVEKLDRVRPFLVFENLNQKTEKLEWVEVRPFQEAEKLKMVAVRSFLVFEDLNQEAG